MLNPFILHLAILSAPASAPTIPAELRGWAAQGPVKSYTPDTIYDFMDGGAEVYLAYGVKALHTRIYQKAGENPVTLSLFEMASPAGAYGVFTFERVDVSAGIGQDSEYGAGILRYWQGKHFVFIQAERESPAAKDLILELGRDLLLRLGQSAAIPALTRALPREGLRPLSLRFTLGPQFLATMETTLMDNALGLPANAEAAVARYGKPGQGERVLLARYGNPAEASKGLHVFLGARRSQGWKLGEIIRTESGWSGAALFGRTAVLVLDAPSMDAAKKRLEQTLSNLKEVEP